MVGTLLVIDIGIWVIVRVLSTEILKDTVVGMVIVISVYGILHKSWVQRLDFNTLWV